MNRHVLASRALDVSQTILVTVPVKVRVASIVQSFLRQAFSRDDMTLSIGLQALISMEEAGTPGDIEGKTIEELRPFIRQNALSKLRGVANALGSKIFRISLAGKRNIPLPLLEEAWTNYTATLQKHPLAADRNVGQAIHYLANGFTLRIKDVLDNKTRREEIRQNPEFGESVHREHDPSTDETALWNQIERKFKSNPHLLGPNGEPWAWIYVEGKSGGMSEEQIIEQWNDASRRSGGKGGITRSTFLSWLKNPQRQSLMRQITKLYLDDDALQGLKVAAARGALDSVTMMPFERDLLALLV